MLLLIVDLQFGIPILQKLEIPHISTLEFVLRFHREMALIETFLNIVDCLFPTLVVLQLFELILDLLHV